MNSGQVSVAIRGDTFLIAIACTGRGHVNMCDFSHHKYFTVEHTSSTVFI